MQKRYIYEPKAYFSQVTLTSIFTALILAYCIYQIIIGFQPILFGLIGLVAAYTSWNTFIARANPSQVVLEEDGISFVSFGKVDKYPFDQLKSFQVREFRGSGKMFIRVNNSNLLRGRYWLNTREMNDGEELFLYILKLEHHVHPNSIKAKSWNSVQPELDKTPYLPWQQPKEQEEQAE